MAARVPLSVQGPNDVSRGQRVGQVVLGILASRVSGLVRTRVLAHFFGVSALGDVWTAALRSANVVQNLLGEQSLSAAFIPIYVRKLAGDDEREASRFAGAILSLLLVSLSVVALLGVLLAGPIVTVLNAGLLRDAAAVEMGIAEIDRFELAVRAVRIVFPMTCILVLSAWCLAILNSHERFFLAYFAPVLWNAAIIATAVWIGRVSGDREGNPRCAFILTRSSHRRLGVCWPIESGKSVGRLPVPQEQPGSHAEPPTSG